MQTLFLILSFVVVPFVSTFLIYMAFSPTVRNVVFHALGRMGTEVWCILLQRKPIVLPLYTKDYGHLGLRVYVGDEAWAKRISAITGNKTITERNIKVLQDVGFRFAITTHQPMDVPTWILEYLEEYSLLGYNLNGVR